MPFDAADIDPEVYEHLRALARRIYNERAGQGESIQPTILLHEAWERINKTDNAFNDRAHFMATAAVVMRHVLVDRARAKRQLKRGADRVQTTLSGLADGGEEPVSVLDLDRALEALRRHRPIDAEVVLLRSVGGLTIPEVAEVMGIGTTTVSRSWRRGRAFLLYHLSQAEDPDRSAT